MVVPDVRPDEAVAHLEFGMAVLVKSLRKFMRNVDGKEQMDFAECCTYIDRHWSDYFSDDNNGMFLRVTEISTAVWTYPIAIHRYIHYIEWLREVALRIRCPHLEYKITHKEINGRRLYSTVDEESSNDNATPEAPETSATRISLLLEQGKSYCRHKKWSKAIETFDLINEAGERSPEAVFYRALCYLRIGLLNIAEENAEEATILDGSHKEYFKLLVEVRIAMNKFKEALEACENGLQLDPIDEELLKLKEKCLTLVARNEPVKPYCYNELSLLEKAKIQCNLEKWSDAMILLNEEIFRESEQAEAYFYRALCRLRLNLLNLAYEDAERALMLSPNRPDYYARLAEISAALRDFGEAQFICETGLELDQTNEELLHLQTQIQGQSGLSIRKSGSSSVSELMEKGKALYEQTQWAEAEHAFSEVIVKDLKQAEAYFFRALCEIRLDLMDLARDSVEDAIRLVPDRLDYHLKLAEILFEMKKYAEALTTCKRGLELDNSNEELLQCKKSCLNEVGRK